MKKFDLALDTGSPEKDEQTQAAADSGEAPGSAGLKGGPGGLNLALNLGLVQRPDQTADAKEQLYDAYDPSSSRKKAESFKEVAPVPGLGKPSTKPKFSLNMGAITGEAPSAAAPHTTANIDQNAAGEETITGFGAAGAPQAPSTSKPGRFAALADNVSNVSASPLNAGQMSNRFRARMGAGGIPTPLGSDMSRAKFDFSGYDPQVMRKKKEPSPERKVITKIEEDMEVFITDTREDPDAVDLDKRNAESASAARGRIRDEMYSLLGGGDEDQSDMDRIAEVRNFQTKIDEEAIDAKNAFKFFNEQEYKAVEAEQTLLDLQVGGPAAEDRQLLFSSQFDSQTLPSIKLERLAMELNQLEEELRELEKTDIPSGFGDENDAASHINEVGYLRTEMQKILGSEAFSSLEGKSKIQTLLNEGTQTSIENALNQLIEQKVVEYSASDEQDGGSFKVGDVLELSLQPSGALETANAKMEKDILDKYQLVDQALDASEHQLGYWQPQNKFNTLYHHLDELCDKVDDLDTRTMDNIGNRAKELNKDLEDVVRRLQTMSDVNYDKNKIDYLFTLLESCLESEEHVEIITERLKALERIHKESPNIDASINTIVERQKLIDLSFKAEDQQIAKTKKQFIDTMYEVQTQLKEVTMLQKNTQQESMKQS